MHDYRDLSRLTTVAIWCVAIYMVLELLFGAASLYDWMIWGPVPPELATTAPFAALGMLLGFVASVIVVGRWIYRASANAHAISDQMTISPGWAVGSYFIPILNLFRPFQAMREIWLASHFRGNWHGEPSPTLLVVWWGLWIVTNMLGWVAFRLEQALELVLILDLVTSVLIVPLCLALIAIMRRISQAQAGAGYDEVFA